MNGRDWCLWPSATAPFWHFLTDLEFTITNLTFALINNSNLFIVSDVSCWLLLYVFLWTVHSFIHSVIYSFILSGYFYKQGCPQAGARDCTCTPLDFAFQCFWQNTIHAQIRICHRDAVSFCSLISTEWNATEGVGVSKLDKYALQPFTSLDKFTSPGKNPVGAHVYSASSSPLLLRGNYPTTTTSNCTVPITTYPYIVKAEATSRCSGLVSFYAYVHCWLKNCSRFLCIGMFSIDRCFFIRLVVNN